MKNENDLSKQYFNENKIPTRQDLWNKLIEQDEKINELEKYKSKYTNCLDEQLERENATHDCLLKSKSLLDKLKQENQQLQQSQNQKAIEVLEEIFELFDFYENSECEDFVTPKEVEISFLNFLEDKLTELKRSKI